MIRTDDIDGPVDNIRHLVEDIRRILPDYEVPSVDGKLDEILEECNELGNLEEGEAEDDNPVYDMLEDLGLAGLWNTYQHIDVGTANDLREAFTKIVKFHGYQVE